MHRLAVGAAAPRGLASPRVVPGGGKARRCARGAGGQPSDSRSSCCIRGSRGSTRAEAAAQDHAGPAEAHAAGSAAGEELRRLAEHLRRQPSAEAKVDALLAVPAVRELAERDGRLMAALDMLGAEQAYVLLCLPAIGQRHVLQTLPDDAAELRARLAALADTLLEADGFYSSLGGLVGYQAKCLELIARNARGAKQADPCPDVELHVPQGPNLDGPGGRRTAAAEAAKGLAALPHMAEIWPLGGAGDRLGLECPATGRSVPTAMLPYCGRTLLEGLVRDLQAREALHFRVHGRQAVTPVVVMTSDAKDNHAMVCDMLRAFDWFGRGRDAFMVIKQPLVPVLAAASGEWLLPEALAPLMKPGGHGAVWKLMLDEGAFAWLRARGAQAALVRQISNPLAGTDATMLSLLGAGYGDGRTFGFAACAQTAGAAEGVDVLLERRLPRPDGRGHEFAYNVTNIEYTEFERLGLPPGDPRLAALPANTNVLYVNLRAAEAAVRAGCAAGGGAALPGMVFNGRKTVAWTDAASGALREEPAGRMECTMQNLVDSLAQRFSERLPPERHALLNTFVVFNARRKVTSSAKRRRQPGSSVISQTPDGSFRDLMLNGMEVLQRCGFATPEVGSVEQYLARGPGAIFLFHPGLGPLWDVVAQKLRGGALAPGSELVLEIAEAAIVDLRLSGSLLVQADCVLGSPAAPADDTHGWGDAGGSARPLTFRASADDAAQFQMPDLSKAGSMVVPLQRRRDGSGSPRSVLEVQERPPAPPARAAACNDRCARVRMSGVVVRNRGVDWACPDNVYWQHKVARHEATRVLLHGQAEFEACDVVLSGPHTFEVPDGYRMVVSAGPGGSVRRRLEPLVGRRPGWEWRYACGAAGAVRLALAEPRGAPPRGEADAPFTYMI